MTREEEFLAGLTELTNKLGLKLENCGCCGGIWFEETTKQGKYEANELGEYTYGPIADGIRFEETE